MVPPVEKEHMFDKVVTPSDVGKLNRLVLPKQHAEKYFPSDSSVNDKGLLLFFEDDSGKPWRFRYSYWKSSQSYVITKGWSLFVKKHCLNAGDTVSFARGSGNAAHDRLFIDCKRCEQTVYSAGGYQHSNPILSFNRSPFVPCGSTLGGGRQYMYFPSSATVPRVSVQDRVLDSVPVVRGQKAAKRVRLFGVNLDCPDSDCRPPAAELQPMLDFPHLHLRLGGSSEGKQTLLDRCL